MRIVQLSDLHLRPEPLYSGIDPWRRWRAALARLGGLQPRPDLLLLSGDLADDAAPATYSRLADSLATVGFDYAVVPGNHDDSRALRKAFPGQGWSHEKYACQRVDRGELSLLLVDTAIPGREEGMVGDEHLAWLTAHCPVGRRVVLVLHHPPFPIGIPGMDAIACGGEQGLAAWLSGRPQVEALWCGHVHRPVLTQFAGRPAVCAPSTVHQIALVEGPLAWTDEPPGMLVHDFVAGWPIRSHYLPLAVAPVTVYTD